MAFSQIFRPIVDAQGLSLVKLTGIEYKTIMGKNSNEVELIEFSFKTVGKGKVGKTIRHGFLPVIDQETDFGKFLTANGYVIESGDLEENDLLAALEGDGEDDSEDESALLADLENSELTEGEDAAEHPVKAFLQHLVDEGTIYRAKLYQKESKKDGRNYWNIQGDSFQRFEKAK